MHMSGFLVVSLFFLSSFASAQNLTEIEKNKVLFMIFENQNKKIVFEKSKKCPKDTKQDWFCQTPTVKHFLMNTIRIQAQTPALVAQNLHCEKISPELQKTAESLPRLTLGALEFRREIRESLSNQWLCLFSVEQTLPSGVESFEDASVYRVREDGAAHRKVGISFLMNRDKSRIVSRRVAGWIEPVL